MAILDGRFIGSGNKNLYIKPTGAGLPAIVIETAWGSLSSEWQPLQEALSQLTTVISYDRAGYGESPENIKPRTGKQIVAELYTMLSNTGIPGPYLFIGEAAGGFYVQHFAKQYPELVCGMILLDSTTSRIFEFDELDAPKFQEVASINKRMEGLRAFVEMDENDFNNTVPHFLKDLFPNFPDDLQEQLTAYMCDQKLYRTVMDEYDALKESIDLFKILKEFPNIPLTVLCRDPKLMIEISKQIGVPEEEAKAAEDLWIEHLKELQTLTDDCKFEIVENSTQSLHLSNPAKVFEEAKSMLEKLSGLTQMMNEGRILEF